MKISRYLAHEKRPLPGDTYVTWDQALKASSHSGRTSLPDPRSADIAQGHAAPYLSPAAEAQVSS